MLASFFCSALILLCTPSYILCWPLLCLFLFFLYLSLTNCFLNQSLFIGQSFTLVDSVSIFIVILLFFIMYVAYVNSVDFGSYKLIRVVFLSLTIFCFQVFTTSHLFSLYFFYEASLIPILYIIIKWGSYPERSVSAIIILVYTLLFGAPVLVLIMYFNRVTGSWLYSIYDLSGSSLLFTMFIFLCFSVKLPIYGLHFWLPIAHVEAPTFGSVILASVLLKLGGVGLLRLRDFISQSSMLYSLLAYFIVFIIYRCLVCCYQADLKRLIAYSSVAHIIVIPFLVIVNNSLAVQALVMVMLLHGLSSTLLFMSVGVLYSMFSSRQLVLMRGLILISPLFRFLLIITFLFTLSAPPLPSFIAEVFFIISSYQLTSHMLYVVLVFAFLGLVYNLNWLVATLFATGLNTVYSYSNLKYSLFIPLFSTLLAIGPLTGLFFML